MQSKLLLPALLVSAASFVVAASDSTQDAFTTALPSFISQQISQIEKSLDSYQASVSTESKFIAINDYIASAPTDFASEFSKENVAYFSQLPTTGSVELPAHITALPSSLQGYASSVLKGEASIIDTGFAALGVEVSAAEKSPSANTKTSGSPSTTITQTGSTSTISGSEPNNTSSASGSSTAAAPTNSASSASPSSSSSATGNTAAQPTGALKAVGALAAGVIGFIAVA